jgi:two-component sensor histidine kinase
VRDAGQYVDGDRRPDDPARRANTFTGGERVPTGTTPFAQALDGSTGMEQIGSARERFERWLEHTDVDRETAAELAVVFSELAANAVTASPEGTLAQLRARREDARQEVVPLIVELGWASGVIIRVCCDGFGDQLATAARWGSPSGRVAA